jgi:hypothetical protein
LLSNVDSNPRCCQHTTRIGDIAATPAMIGLSKGPLWVRPTGRAGRPTPRNSCRPSNEPSDRHGLTGPLAAVATTLMRPARRCAMLTSTSAILSEPDSRLAPLGHLATGSCEAVVRFSSAIRPGCGPLGWIDTPVARQLRGLSSGAKQGGLTEFRG